MSFRVIVLPPVGDLNANAASPSLQENWSFETSESDVSTTRLC